jgi:hypothetical protein
VHHLLVLGNVDKLRRICGRLVVQFPVENMLLTSSGFVLYFDVVQVGVTLVTVSYDEFMIDILYNCISNKSR